MKAIYKELIQRLGSLPGVRYVGEDVGQLGLADDRIPVTFPAILVSLDNSAVNSSTKEGCREDVHVRVTIVDDTSLIASNLTSDMQVDRALRIFDIQQLVQATLTADGWHYVGFQKTTRLLGLREVNLSFTSKITTSYNDE